MAREGITGLYGLDQNRIKKHEDLCEEMMVDRIKSKEICMYLDKSIGFDLDELNQDYDHVLEKYAKKLVKALSECQ